MLGILSGIIKRCSIDQHERSAVGSALHLHLNLLPAENAVTWQLFEMYSCN